MKRREDSIAAGVLSARQRRNGAEAQSHALHSIPFHDKHRPSTALYGMLLGK